MAKRTIRGNPKVAVAYLRASKREQRLSPDAQRDAIQGWAAREGVTIAAWHVDAISGGAALEKRRGLVAALDSLPETGAGLLVIAKRDRLARDVMNAAMIERLAEKAGAQVISAQGEGNGDTPEAMMLRGIMDVFAQYERALIRYRTRAALAVKRARGERVGYIPFGLRLAADGKSLTTAPAEQEVLERMHALRASGLSLRGVAAELEALGFRGRSGAPISHVSVANALATAAATATK
jgi:DNA invertase Pin-like site-specific DNA recombinase